MMHIYLVRSGGLLSPDAAPVAGFTDYGELRAWLRLKEPDTLGLLKVYRMEDGGTGAVIEISINDIITKEDT